MKKVQDHIESITNGNSKGLAYWIAIGVISLVLNWATEIVGMVTKRDVTSATIEKQDKQIEKLTDIVYELRAIKRDINDGHEEIIDNQKDILEDISNK